jgi:hypothetical protein
MGELKGIFSLRTPQDLVDKLSADLNRMTAPAPATMEAQHNSTYSYAGTLVLRTDFFELLDASHEGFRDIQAFSPSGAGAGVRTMYQMSEGEYHSVESVEINPQDGVKRMYPPDVVELNW